MVANLPEYTVSEIAGAVKRVVEDHFGYVKVRGEISGLKIAASGHAYFSLKDADAVLDAVSWKGSIKNFAVKPEDGLEVFCYGRVTTYPGRSKYQMIVEKMEMAGAGALMALLEERRKKLEAEGLFKAERKKPIPMLPELIGVVTSPTGAVIRDILHRIGERFPRHVLLWPTLVQGEGAAEQIAAAIRGFNAMERKPDVLIVARGGGSLEDLWSFNEEIVVRAAAESSIPLISAVGHETDTTLIDFAADRRAPTPTAAAEMAVPVREELRLALQSAGSRIYGCITKYLSKEEQLLAAHGRALARLPQLLELAAQRFDDWAERFSGSLLRGLERQTAKFEKLAAKLSVPKRALEHAALKLESALHRLQLGIHYRMREAEEKLQRAAPHLMHLDYRQVLARGFILARDSDGKLVTSAKTSAKALELEFFDGKRNAEFS